MLTHSLWHWEVVSTWNFVPIMLYEPYIKF